MRWRPESHRPSDLSAWVGAMTTTGADKSVQPQTQPNEGGSVSGSLT
jgi:hypothetical protein